MSTSCTLALLSAVHSNQAAERRTDLRDGAVVGQDWRASGRVRSEDVCACHAARPVACDNRAWRRRLSAYITTRRTWHVNVKSILYSCALLVGTATSARGHSEQRQATHEIMDNACTACQHGRLRSQCSRHLPDAWLESSLPWELSYLQTDRLTDRIPCDVAASSHSPSVAAIGFESATATVRTLQHSAPAERLVHCDACRCLLVGPRCKPAARARELQRDKLVLDDEV